jgi:hypothetical protein
MSPNDAKKKYAGTVLELFGETFSGELGIGVERNTPAPLFQLLCFALLSSARISSRIAISAFRALMEQGWITPEKMAGARSRKRIRVLNRSGYARYDGITSEMLETSAATLMDKYQGDLRELRAAADRDPGRERELLKGFKGIGDTGVDIFFREVQVAWRELFPFADRMALEASRSLDMGQDAEALLDLVGQKDYPRLIAGLVRVRLEHQFERIYSQANKAK